MYPPINRCCNPNNNCYDPYDYTQYCDNVSITSIVLGFVLIAGTIISTSPQAIKLIIKKTTIGVSFHWLYIASFSQWSSLLNVYTANISKMLGATQSYVKCWSSIVSFYQECVLFGCYQITIILFLIYEYRGKHLCRRMDDEDVASQFGETDQQPVNPRNSQLLQYCCFIVFMLCTGIPMFACGIYFGSCNKILKGFAFGFGVFSSALVCVEWIPQIIKTCRFKDAGSFSVVGIALQCPGCAGCLLVSILQKNPWYAWLTWIASFCLEFALLVILIKLYFDKKKAASPSQQYKQSELTDNLIVKEVQKIHDKDQNIKNQQNNQINKKETFQYIDQECSDSYS